MGKGKLILIVVILALVLMGGIGILTLTTSPLIHGYDGPVAMIVDIDGSEYGEGVNENYRETVTPTHAEVYLAGLEPLGVLAPCGLRMELQGAPNVIESDIEIMETLTRSVIDREAETNTTTTVQVQRVPCDMVVVVSTYQGGLASCYGATFWIQVEENAYSIVSNADQNIVWIEHIYTIDAPVEQGSMEYIPTMGGYTFPLTTVSKHPVPQWLIDAGYQTTGELFEVVKFSIEILSGVPSYDWPNIRTESSVFFHIGFDVILVGEWTNVHPYLEGIWPEPEDQTWLIILILLALVGVVGSVFIIVRLGGRFHPILLLFFVIICWVPVLLWVSMDLIGKLQEFLGGIT